MMDSKVLGSQTFPCSVLPQRINLQKVLPRPSADVESQTLTSHTATVSCRRHTRCSAIATPRVKVPEIKERTTELTPKQLTEYFKRISLPEPLQNERRLGRLDLDLLKALVSGHLKAIPFENLSLVNEKAKQVDNDRISLDLQDVFGKLVTRKRGGYCFEQNALMASVLSTMGFRLYTTMARSIPDGTPQKSKEINTNGLDHEIIVVTLDSKDYIVDVGFGAQTPKEPILITESSLERFKNKGKGDHRLRKGYLGKKLGPQDRAIPAREGWYMQRLPRGANPWTDIYFFTQQEFLPKDYSVANWFWSQNPDLAYRKNAIACIHTEDGRITLQDKRLRIFKDALVDEKELSSDAEVEQALKEHFGIEL